MGNTVVHETKIVSVALLFEGNSQRTFGTKKLFGITVQTVGEQDEYDILAAALRTVRRSREADVHEMTLTMYDVSFTDITICESEVKKIIEKFPEILE